MGSPGGKSSRASASPQGGSSGKSSRSSSRDVAHDGDISSRCSSGHGVWESSTNSSELSRTSDHGAMSTTAGPRAKLDLSAEPSANDHRLYMPNPIRKGVLLPPAILGEEPAEEGGGPRAECAGGPCGWEAAWQLCGAHGPPLAAGLLEVPTEVEAAVQETERPANPFRRERHGRDGPPRHTWGPDFRAWTAAPLVRYLKRVALQIDSNVRNKSMPTTDRLDAFVSKLIDQSKRQLRSAPKKVRPMLQQHFVQQFQYYWDFLQNTKVNDITPEELKWSLISLIETLITAFKVNPEALE